MHCILLASCNRAKPSINFTQVPDANPGGSDTRGVISGSVTGYRTGQRIVLFAHSGNRWWVQPFAQAPYTSIKPDGSWSANIHLGVEYAAMLVNRDYIAQSIDGALPAPGSGVIAITTAPGLQTPSAMRSFESTTLRFSGYDWEVRTNSGAFGGRNHTYAADNIWVDGSGAMHLRMTRKQNQWVCSEAHIVRTLGYGTYRLMLKNVGQLEPAAMFSMFTWTDLSAEQNHHEMDIRVSRLGGVANKSAEYVVQPYYLPANVYRFDMPIGPITTTMRWTTGNAAFSTSLGSGDSKPVAAWSFTSGVPPSSDEKTYVNLCEFGYSKLPMQHETEVVIDHFQFLP